MQVFNEACNTIAEAAFREKCASKFALQKLVYDEVRKQFGLSAQLTVRAMTLGHLTHLRSMWSCGQSQSQNSTPNVSLVGMLQTRR
jgi:hypothetical protein